MIKRVRFKILRRRIGKVFSIGASGFVGGPLRQAGIIDNDASDPDLDVTSQESVDKWIKNIPDGSTILYLAAYTNVDGAQKEPQKAEDVNVEGLRRVLKALEKKKNLFFIYLSTDMVFEASEDSPGPYAENTIPSGKGIGKYAQTKLIGEGEVAESGIPHAIVRISFPWGGRMLTLDEKTKTKKPEPRDYVVKLLTAVTTWPLYSNQVVTPTYLPDLVEFLKWLTKERRSGIWHVASERTSPSKLVKAILEKIGKSDILVREGTLVNPPEGGEKSPRPIKGGLDSDYTQNKSKKYPHSLESAVTERLKELREIVELLIPSPINPGEE